MQNWVKNKNTVLKASKQQCDGDNVRWGQIKTVKWKCLDRDGITVMRLNFYSLS